MIGAGRRIVLKAAAVIGHRHDYSIALRFYRDRNLLGSCMSCSIADGFLGNPEERAFSVFCFQGDRLAGIESINRPGDHMFGRRLLGAGASITPDEAADPAFDLKARLGSLPRTAA